MWWKAGFELEDAEKWIKEITTSITFNTNNHCVYTLPTSDIQQRYGATTKLSAFIKSKEFVGILDPSIIGIAGLELKITNPTIQRIIAFIQKPIEGDGVYWWNVEVDADVKTKEKPDCVRTIGSQKRTKRRKLHSSSQWH